VKNQTTSLLHGCEHWERNIPMCRRLARRDRLYGRFRFGNLLPSRFSTRLPRRLPYRRLRKHTDVESHV